MKGSTLVQNNDEVKTTQTKTKKGAKSRAKSAKTSSEANNIANSNNTPGPKTITSSSTTSVISGTTNANIMVNAPSTPTSSLFNNTNNNNTYEVIPGSNSITGNQNIDIPIKNSQKSYAGFEGKSIKVIWEQYDQYDTHQMELAPEVCNRLAEDASYKLWEVCNNLKIFARNSGGSVTYDLVNEVLSQYDCPPTLGAMDSDWERIDFDGSYFFHSDKVIELRDEYQRQEILPLRQKRADIVQYQAIDDRYLETIKKYTSSLLNVIICGDARYMDQCLNEVAFSPFIGSILRILLMKIIQLLAFKQSDAVNKRCWRFLRALMTNPSTNYIFCREEYFHLAEILICQLMAPYESIKDLKSLTDTNEHIRSNINGLTNGLDIKLNGEDIKPILDIPIKQENSSYLDPHHQQEQQQQQQLQQQQQQQQQQTSSSMELQPTGLCCKFVLDNSESDNDDEKKYFTNEGQYSHYFASPVEAKYVDQLCDTIGILASENSLFRKECTHHILRRLSRFFQGREPASDKEYNYIGRGVRGLVALGEFAFREFIPFFYKMQLTEIPESINHDFLFSALYLKGYSDTYLYEALELICGADKLQPFLIYFAHFRERYLKHRIKCAKKQTYNILPVMGVRRLEWRYISSGKINNNREEYTKSNKQKETLYDLFPELTIPNLNINRPGTIRFKFAGCRPVLINKANKNSLANATKSNAINTANSITNFICSSKIKTEASEKSNSDILVARRKLYKPLTNGYDMVRLSNFYTLRI